MIEQYYVKNGVKVKVNNNANSKKVAAIISNNARKKEEDLRVQRVVIHVTKSEKLIIKELAKTNGMDTSSFLRCLCLYKYNQLIKGMVQ